MEKRRKREGYRESEGERVRKWKLCCHGNWHGSEEQNKNVNWFILRECDRSTQRREILMDNKWKWTRFSRLWWPFAKEISNVRSSHIEAKWCSTIWYFRSVLQCTDKRQHIQYTTNGHRRILNWGGMEDYLDRFVKVNVCCWHYNCKTAQSPQYTCWLLNRLCLMIFVLFSE